MKKVQKTKSVKSISPQDKAFLHLQEMLLEFQLAYFLSPELSKSQKNKLYKKFSNVLEVDPTAIAKNSKTTTAKN